jgi:hypothetical protein
MTLIVVTGPPAAGKSTWVRRHAQSTDVVIDYDTLAVALSGPGADTHHHPPAVRAVAGAARRAAIAAALRHRDTADVYLIHSAPTPRQLSFYRRCGARIVTVDPGRDVVADRCRRERPQHLMAVVDDYYGQSQIDNLDRTTASRSW